MGFIIVSTKKFVSGSCTSVSNSGEVLGYGGSSITWDYSDSSLISPDTTLISFKLDGPNSN